MQGLVITDQGLEETAIEELKELIQAEGKTLEPCIVEFSIKKEQDLCLLAYKAQSIRQVMLLLGKAPCKSDLESVEKAAKKLAKEVDWKVWLKKGASFRCNAEHTEETDFNSMDLARVVGGEVFDLLKSLKLDPKVSLKNPEVILFALKGEKQLCLGMDFAGRDLSKRAYKIYHHSSALKGTIAYAAVRFSGFKPNECLVDPFAGSGIIPIEAALFSSGFSVNHFNKGLAFQKVNKLKVKDKDFDRWEKVRELMAVQGSDHLLMHIKASQNNAKIAGVDKWAKFSKGDVEWLDTQFKKQSVGHIVTHPPEPSQHSSERDIEKVYREFFYQADFILKKGGNLTVLATKKGLLLRMAEERKFKVEAEREVWSGKMMYFMLRLKRT
ncbi:MAG TPA: THUMP domain-containing protein [Candidatus Nanoarchaeia archaeon]|nr:THUMP domain-containing protein [Candidatus Nanoarchaeia archaeon]